MKRCKHFYWCFSSQHTGVY